MNVNLVLQKKNGTSRTIRLPSSVTVIGRRADCDLYAPLMSVSKRHCQLNCDQGVLRIRDLGSRNGTYLNGERINGEAEIKAGDHVKIGSLTFVCQIDGQPADMDVLEVAENSTEKGVPPEELVDEMLEAFDDLDELETLDDVGSI
jgi:pSer/pThr/pTyr-binding forkhead associated (FHA) protein